MPLIVILVLISGLALITVFRALDIFNKFLTYGIVSLAVVAVTIVICYAWRRKLPDLPLKRQDSKRDEKDGNH